MPYNPTLSDLHSKISNLTEEIALLKTIRNDTNQIVLNRIISRLENEKIHLEYQLIKLEAQNNQDRKRGLRY